MKKRIRVTSTGAVIDENNYVCLFSPAEIEENETLRGAFHIILEGKPTLMGWSNCYDAVIFLMRLLKWKDATIFYWYKRYEHQCKSVYTFSWGPNGKLNVISGSITSASKRRQRRGKLLQASKEAEPLSK